ncbi:expressed unknown protein [Seminavis robusta]|uniref:PDZ domain-containing protein n=1 Tax=Seminavis robusta TaxID=568900 RepID=A0A9N8E563_9STRA|nr:expressed unknown protein [Seminavis robusta]|eukprot:Sro529_g161000.1 n/a (158) ;mRNA; f:24115-24588
MPAQHQQQINNQTENYNNHYQVMEYTIKKPIPHSYAGISFRKDGKGKLYISSLHQDGLFFRKTNIMTGFHVLKVNGVRVENMHPQHVTAIIRNARGTVTIVVAEPSQQDDAAKETTQSHHRQQQQPKKQPQQDKKGTIRNIPVIGGLQRILMMPKAA